MGKRKYSILFILLAFLVLGTSPKTLAANMIKTAKANSKELGKQVTGGKLYKKNNRIRFKYKNGKSASDIWLYYKGHVYCFKANGNARKNRFFKYEGEWYYADRNSRVLHNKWVRVKKKYYYLKKDGVRAAGETLKMNGRKFVFKKNGKLDTKKSDRYTSSRYLFVGDSRTVGMQMCVGGKNTKYIGKVSMGYSWLASTAGPQVKKILSSSPGTNVIFCFGVNDPGNVGAYIAYYQRLVRAYPRTNFFFMSVNPCGSGRAALNRMSASFNARLKKAFKNRYIDTWTYLVKHGFSSFDGVHYTAPTYSTIYNLTVKYIRNFMPV